jgi:thiopeptide-type bacteriocin biosynthesis protein
MKRNATRQDSKQLGLKQLGLKHSQFFAMRTPLLPWEDFQEWNRGVESGDSDDATKSLAANCDALRGRLRAMLDRPEVRDAVFVASPSLHESIDAWRENPDSVRGLKTERSLVRYFARMTGRPTPFGLFAGCSVGAIGDATDLSLAARDGHARSTRLDAEYVQTLASALERNPLLRKDLKFRPNSTLYRSGGRVRYAESRFASGQRSHHLVSVEENEYLVGVLDRAARGATPGELADVLVDDEVTHADALEFVDELIEAQILGSELEPSLTGPEPIHALIATLEKYSDGAEYARVLRDVRSELTALDSGGAAKSSDYLRIANLLESLPAKFDLPRLFQVDLFKPAPGATLSTSVVDEMIRGVSVLAAMTDQDSQSPLAEFKQAFVQRYDRREVSLVEALDEETGIGFGKSQAPELEGSPLLAGIAVSQPLDAPASWTDRYSFLLAKLIEAGAAGRQSIELSNEDVQQMAAARPAPMPGALAAIGTIAARSAAAINDGDFQVVLQGAMGPSGARMLGRFCHGDAELRQLVEQHLREEEAQTPDAIYAELVHWPEGRTGNVLMRPVLRGYEIAYLGRSGADNDMQIPVTDLTVRVEGDRIVLRSASLDKEIIPRLSNAHNYGWKGLGVYKFLCAMQHQASSGGYFWSWGPLESAPFLPRVTNGRVVLSRARWLVAADELKSLTQGSDAERFAAVQRLRRERNLPQFVALREGDHELPMDLENWLSIDAALDTLKGHSSAALVEMFVDDLATEGPEGRFLHEIVVPLINEQPQTVGGPTVGSPTVSSPTVSSPVARRQSVSMPSVRRFAPGSEWLYVKVYAGSASVDRLLREHLAAVVEQATASRACDQWFFLRYSDPEPHVRVRFHGDPQRLLGEVMPLLERALAEPLDEGWVSRVQYDTYEREVERYGGDEGILVAEQFFAADSAAALEILGACSGDEGLDARWRLAVRSADQLLDDLDFSLPQKLELAQTLRDGFAREFGVGAAYKEQTSARFRAERPSLEALLDRRQDEGSLFEPGLAALARRSERLQDVAATLHGFAEAGRLDLPLADLASSFLHMSINRLLRSAHRAQELVLYDFLARLYQSASARSRSAATPGATSDRSEVAEAVAC